MIFFSRQSSIEDLLLSEQSHWKLREREKERLRGRGAIERGSPSNIIWIRILHNSGLSMLLRKLQFAFMCYPFICFTFISTKKLRNNTTLPGQRSLQRRTSSIQRSSRWFCFIGLRFICFFLSSAATTKATNEYLMRYKPKLDWATRVYRT